MPRYVAFLRGVSPLNASMAELRGCFEEAGFTEVRTLLSSGNVAFSTRSKPPAALERKCERAMQARLARSFITFIRPTAHLQQLIDSDPHGTFALPPGAKRILTFLRNDPPPDLALPIARDGAAILQVRGRDVVSAYLPGADGPAFMRLLERSFGPQITTRTLETVQRCAGA